MLKWLFAALLVLQAHFAASYLVPLDREAQGTFGGLLRWALGNRRRWAAGPNPGLWRLPGLRSLPRWECGRALFPRCPSDGRDLGSVWLVEGAGHKFHTLHSGI